MNRQQSFQNTKASLYIIATPIGNLKEISKRCIEAIEDSAVIFCEDTRVTGQLLNYLNIKKPLISAYENIERQSSEKIISYLRNNQNVAFMSDAGYPGISDPGSIAIQEVIKEGFNIIVINGPSAIIQSVLASGFDTSHFYFYGFLNAKQSTRKKELESLKEFENTMVFYQSPHKLRACLEDMLEIFKDREICLCRELTKLYEEFIRGKISEIIPLVDTLKGEMVIVVKGYQKENIQGTIDESCIKKINKLIKKGMKTNDAIKEIAAKLNVSKKELYNYYHNGGN